jgi:hypothetical protein
MATSGPGLGSGLDPSPHDRLPPIREHDDITGLKIRRNELEDAEVVADWGQEVLRALQVPPRFALFQRPDIDVPEIVPV